MLAEFMDKLVELTHKSITAKFVTHENLPDSVFLNAADGTLTEKAVPPPLREHRILTIQDIVKVVEDDVMADSPEVWVGQEAVSVILAREKRREVVTCPLVLTEQFQTLSKLRIPIQLEPRDAIKLLRFGLHGSNTEGVVQALRRVDFVRTSAGKSTVEHGNESLGRSVEAAVQQADDIPDRFTVSVPVWRGFSYTANVKCGCYLDLETQRVELSALADEMERALEVCTGKLAGDIDGLAAAPVFQGTV